MCRKNGCFPLRRRRRRSREVEEEPEVENAAERADEPVPPSTEQPTHNGRKVKMLFAYFCPADVPGTSQEADDREQTSETEDQPPAPRPLGFKRRLLRLLGYQGRTNRVVPL